MAQWQKTENASRFHPSLSGLQIFQSEREHHPLRISGICVPHPCSHSWGWNLRKWRKVGKMRNFPHFLWVLGDLFPKIDLSSRQNLRATPRALCPHQSPHLGFALSWVLAGEYERKKKTHHWLGCISNSVFLPQSACYYLFFRVLI